MNSVDLKTYLPSCYEEVIEAEAEQDALSIEINKYNNTIEEAMNDQFIQKCSLKAIGYYENTFGIVWDSSNPDETLQFRRDRVLSRMRNLRPPYTYWYLRKILDSFFGAGKYDLQILPDEYIIILESSSENSVWYHEVSVTFTSVVPCNMVFINRPRIDYRLLINESVTRSNVDYAYKLNGTWRLGLRPFIIQSGEMVAKMANVHSITDNLIEQNLNFCKQQVSKVKINNIIQITNLEKTIENSVLTVLYTLNPSIVTTITNIKLLDSNNNVLADSNVYITVEGTVTVKHKLQLKEGV